jgi:hypothetical protein
MKLLRNIALAPFLVGCSAWTPASQPESGVSRRNFVSTSIVGAVLAGASLDANATPSGLSLVAPESIKDKVVVITGATTGKKIFEVAVPAAFSVSALS